VGRPRLKEVLFRLGVLGRAGTSGAVGKKRLLRKVPFRRRVLEATQFRVIENVVSVSTVGK